jgi:hypothetical protein
VAIPVCQQEGIFHHNVVMDLELASPYFKSGKEVERFQMIVMTHKEDGVRSLAIDEFPLMSEAAIERFWIEKVSSFAIWYRQSFIHRALPPLEQIS